MIIGNYATFRYQFGTGVIAVDGMRTFDVANTGSQIRPFTSWNFSFPLTIDLAAADDAVAWVDEWHWYLQEARPLAPLFQLARNDGTTTTRSGRVDLQLTAYGSTIHTIHDQAKLDFMLRGSYLYAKKLATSAIYSCDLHRAAFASASQ